MNLLDYFALPAETFTTAKLFVGLSQNQAVTILHLAIYTLEIFGIPSTRFNIVNLSTSFT